MMEDLFLRMMHHWQIMSRTGLMQTLVPIVLGLDMVHNIYYVACEYRATQREWEETKKKEMTAKVEGLFQRLTSTCALKNADTWPALLTEHLRIPVQMSGQGQATEQSSSKPKSDNVADHGFEDLFHMYSDSFSMWGSDSASRLSESNHKDTGGLHEEAKVRGDSLHRADAIPAGFDDQQMPWTWKAFIKTINTMSLVDMLAAVAPNLRLSADTADKPSDPCRETSQSSTAGTAIQVPSEEVNSSQDSVKQGNPMEMDWQHCKLEEARAILGPPALPATVLPGTRDLSSSEWSRYTVSTDGGDALSSQEEMCQGTLRPSPLNTSSIKTRFEESVTELRQYCRERWPMPLADIQRRSAMRFRINFVGFSQPAGRQLPQECCKNLSHL